MRIAEVSNVSLEGNCISNPSGALAIIAYGKLKGIP